MCRAVSFHFSKYILLAASVSLLGGCEQALTSMGSSLASTDALSIFRDEDVNMTQRNYAAADYLIQQATSYITRGDLIKATTLIDSDEPRVYSALGRGIPEQVGIRLSQLGYKVDLSDVLIQSADPNYRKPVVGQNEKADFILSGSYMRRAQELNISLRITEVSSGQITAVFDYVMPMNREISEMSEPEARIFKIEQ